jgi:hypothetical protein
MPYMLVRHQVADFGKWKPIFDAHAGARRMAGLENVRFSAMRTLATRLCCCSKPGAWLRREPLQRLPTCGMQCSRLVSLANQTFGSWRTNDGLFAQHFAGLNSGFAPTFPGVPPPSCSRRCFFSDPLDLALRKLVTALPPRDYDRGGR